MRNHRSSRTMPCTIGVSALLSLAAASGAIAGSGTGAPAAAAAASQEYEGAPITMKVVNIPLVDFFRTISEVSGLNILIDPDVRGTVTLNMEAVPWDQLFDAVLRSHRLEKSFEGNLVRVSTKDTLRVEEDARRQIKRANFLASDTLTTTRHLNYANATDIAQTLEEQLTERGQIDVDKRTNTLIITDIENSIDRVTGLIATLDIPEAQVEIEARIVEATSNFARELGSEFNLQIGNFTDRNQVTGGVNAGVTDPIGMIGGTFGRVLDMFHLDAVITAAETKGDARLLSKPRVSAQNNAEAAITQGSKIPIPVTQNFTTRVRFETAALKLTVTPQITKEHTVLLTLKVENNVPDFSQTVLGIPTILTSEAQTLVLVPDGGTTVIGGIFTEVDRHEKRKVPGLGDIPIMGYLFKNEKKERETREILFFITVRIK